MPEDHRDPSTGKYLGLGLQMAVGVVLGLVIGGWLERRYGWQPWGTMVGAMLGLAGGMYLLIKEALRMNKD
jgi:F0F1-type ATP synthase assembly protein I